MHIVRFHLILGLTLSFFPAVLSGLSPDTGLSSLQQRVPQLMESADIPGLSLAIIEDGKLTSVKAYGVRDTATGEPVTIDTVFQAASLSKPVFAYLVFRLVEKGLLDLDQPLADHLPYPRLKHDQRYKKITARMILSHSAGLPNWGGTPLEMRFDPGTSFGYSGEGYVYLQKVIEKLTGKALDELAREEVFEPLEMDSSSYVWRESFEDFMALGHDRHGRSQPKNRPSEANAAASLHTTAADYARFLLAVFDRKGLSSSNFSLMFRPQIAARGWGNGSKEAREQIWWGLGWGLQGSDTRNLFWHWGDQGIYRCFVAGDLETKNAFVYFTNSFNGLSIAHDILSLLADPPWALEFLDYDRHDSDAFQTRRVAEKAYLKEGSQIGFEKFIELRETRGQVVDEAFTNRLGHFLLSEDMTSDAIKIFTLNVESYPKSSDARDSLGEAYLEAGQLDLSLQNYQRALELDSEKNEGIERKVNWIQGLIEARKDPVSISLDQLARYEGDYGPRHIRLRDGALFYQRDGNNEYRLIPISENTFALDGLATFQIQFVEDESGNVVQITGHYINGQEDVSPRDPE